MKKSPDLPQPFAAFLIALAFFVLTGVSCTVSAPTVDPGTAELAAKAAALAEPATKENPDPLSMPNKTAYTIPVANFGVAGPEGFRATASLSITLSDLVKEDAEAIFRAKLPELQSKARSVLQTMGRGELEVINTLADSQRRITLALEDVLGDGWVTSVELLALSIQE